MQNKKVKKNNLLSLPVIEVQDNFSIKLIDKAVNFIFSASIIVILLVLVLFLLVDIEIINNSSKTAKLIVQYFNKLF